MMGGFPLIIPTEPVMIVMAVVIMLVIMIVVMIIIMMCGDKNWKYLIINQIHDGFLFVRLSSRSWMMKKLPFSQNRPILSDFFKVKIRFSVFVWRWIII